MYWHLERHTPSNNLAPGNIAWNTKTRVDHILWIRGVYCAYKVSCSYINIMVQLQNIKTLNIFSLPSLAYKYQIIISMYCFMSECWIQNVLLDLLTEVSYKIIKCIFAFGFLQTFLIKFMPFCTVCIQRGVLWALRINNSKYWFNLKGIDDDIKYYSIKHSSKTYLFIYKQNICPFNQFEIFLHL